MIQNHRTAPTGQLKSIRIANLRAQFGQSVAAQRKMKGLQQKEIIERAAEEGAVFSASSYSRLEKGERTIHLEEALALAAVFCLPVETLSKWVQPATPSDRFNAACERVIRTEKHFVGARNELDDAISDRARARKEMEAAS